VNVDSLLEPSENDWDVCGESVEPCDLVTALSEEGYENDSVGTRRQTTSVMYQHERGMRCVNIRHEAQLVKRSRLPDAAKQLKGRRNFDILGAKHA
jgi:hypothetical protein